MPDEEMDFTRGKAPWSHGTGEFRPEQFRSLGFANEDALLLALSPCDLQAARTLRAAGCSVRLAMRILL